MSLYRSRIIAAGLCLALCGGATMAAFPVTHAYADPQSELEAAASKLDSLGATLSTMQSELSLATEEVEATDAAVQQKQSEIEDSQTKLAELRQTLAESMKSNYKQGTSTLLDYILGSTSADDLVSRIYYLDKASEKQANSIAEVKQLEAQLEQDKAELEAKQTEQQQKVDDLNSQVSSYEAQVAEATSVYNALDDEVKEQLAAQENQNVAAAVSAVETSAQQATAETDNGESSSSSGDSQSQPAADAEPETKKEEDKSDSSDSGSDSDSGSSSSSSTGVALALEQVGKPYVYGGAGPNSFDCSGLVCYVYGWKYGHSAGNMMNSVISSGRAKWSVSDLEYGDLVFTRSDGGHVGIYIGNGKFVHAANPSRGVVVDSIYSFYCGGSY